MSTLKFGPEWMRNASSQSKPSGADGGFDGEQPPNSDTWEGAPRSTLRDNPFKYSREMMLELFVPSDVADGFIVNEIVFSGESLAPVCLTELTEKENEILAGPINSGSAKRYNNASNAGNAGQYQSSRQQSSLSYHHPRNGNVGRSGSNGMYATPRARARDSIVRSSGSQSHGAASDPVVGEELAFSNAHGNDNPDNNLWAHQSIARSSVGTFGADGIFRLGGDEDDGGEPLESNPLEDGVGGGDNPSSRNSDIRGDPAGTADGGWARNRVAGDPASAASAANLQLQQQQPSTFRERQLVERAEQLKWWYRDPQGELQGPFSTSHMQEWHALGYFPADLQVCYDGGTGFQLLSAMISSLGNTQSPFLLTALAFVSSSRSPTGGINSPATPAVLSRAASSLRMPSADGESAHSLTSMHVIPTGSSVLVQELLPEARSVSASASASAIESSGANVLHSQGTPAQVPNPSGPASQAMQLTLLLGEQYMLVNTIGEQQLFAVRLQEQHQQNLAKLMQDLSQESNAIHYKAQIDRAPVQPEAIYALQQRAQTAEERLRYEYAQLANTNAQEIALLEAKIDPVIKDIMVRDGAAYALSFINQRLQDLRAQIASEGTQQDPSTGRDNNGANTQHTDSYASEVESPDANATAETESAPMADIDDVQENLERISVSSTKKGSARGAPSAKKAASKTKEGKLATKEQTKHKGSSTQQQDESISAADAQSVPEVHAHSETVGMSEMSPGMPSSKKESSSVSASDKEKNKIKTAVVSSNSISEPAAPWSTSTSTAPKKPKKTLLQIQKEEEEAMMKRQLADEKKRAQALLANPIMATAGMGSSYAGRLGNSSSAGSGSSGLSTAVGGGPGGSSRYSLAAIMEEQSKELSKDSPGLGSGTLGSNSPTASTSVASRIAAAASLPSSQGPPVFSWTTTGGGSSTASSSLSAIATSSNAINSTAVKKQQQKQSTKPTTTTTTTTRTWGGVQKQQDSSASKLPSMEFLEWCYSRLTSLRGIDICKFIEVLLTFPPQVPESALEIISEQIYAYSQSLNGHAFAEDFAKRRRKDYASVRGGSTKSAPENWAQVLKSQPAGTSRLSAGSGSSGYVGRVSAQPSSSRASGSDNSFQTIKRKGRK